MSVEIVPNTPLADALNAAIQPKLVEVGWGTGGTEDAALAEYIVLMLVNGKSQDEIAKELSSDLLGLGPDDPSSKVFSQWLFEQVASLNTQYNPASAPSAQVENGIAGSAQGDMSMEGDFDTDMNVTSDPAAELNAPTGPKSMRTGSGGFRGGREKRIVGQINRAMDRTHESSLHRVRGNAGIGRTPPTGPRGGGVGRQNRMANGGRAASLAQGLAQGMGGPNGPAAMNGMNGMNGAWMMPGGPQPQQSMDIYALIQQQNQMMQQMQQQIMMQQQQQSHGRGPPLKDRMQRPYNNNNNNQRRGGAFQQNGHNAPQPEDAAPTEANGAAGDDVEMSQTQQTNPEDTLCKFNLRCTNKDCKFAHQSPAAPPGTTIDVKDVCTFGAACKNRKCVGRHPSPAAKMAHQSEQDCKFYPNCTNPNCTFRHPSMPLCRNGGECKVPNCKFTHIKTPCKFNPCMNRNCPFTHEEGQRGAFHDKVWTAEGGDHVSERKFADENAAEDVVIPHDDGGLTVESSATEQEVA